MSTTRKTPRRKVGKGGDPKRDEGKEAEATAVDADREACQRCGQIHPGCRAHTKHGPNKGKPCGMVPRIGSLVCVKHGGNHPDHKKKAEQRLLELVDPALAELHRVLTDKRADDSVKVRAALGILDRTGHGPGTKVEVSTKWDDLLADTFAGQIDRAALAEPVDRRSLPSAAKRDTSWEDVDTFQRDAQADAWRKYDEDEAREYAERPNFRTSDTVRGEVVESVILPDPANAPLGASEFGGDSNHPPRYGADGA